MRGENEPAFPSPNSPPPNSEFRNLYRTEENTEVTSSRPGSGLERKDGFMGRRRGKTSGEDRSEGAMDKTKGRLKEAAGAIAGDEDLKAEGRADQRTGTVKEKKGKLKDLFK